jgi:hypothetical protein
MEGTMEEESMTSSPSPDDKNANLRSPDNLTQFVISGEFHF